MPSGAISLEALEKQTNPGMPPGQRAAAGEQQRLKEQSVALANMLHLSPQKGQKGGGPLVPPPPTTPPPDVARPKAEPPRNMGSPPKGPPRMTHVSADELRKLKELNEAHCVYLYILKYCCFKDASGGMHLIHPRFERGGRFIPDLSVAREGLISFKRGRVALFPVRSERPIIPMTGVF